ncbi:hypothetical protein [Janthinobacterium lividum]|uniref:hypothetical protein n=1 Tax=Janthinobacterium lividum TaxID=29581 RepID=UPI001113031F|nr:hypothetical protein [Janthinobacterium lividum]MCC7716446.1 hypothetical protein [Janthinobacterium lividum]WQE30916.1 hypothetical protein U0004_11105 [Janthinobacterium lividum]
MRVYQFRHVGIVTACCLSLHVLQRGQNHKGWRAFGQSTFCTFLQETPFSPEKSHFPMKGKMNLPVFSAKNRHLGLIAAG